MKAVRLVLFRQVAIALVLVLSATVFTATPAEAVDSRTIAQIRDRMQYLINRHRARHGVRKLRVNTTARRWAQDHAREMASRRRVYHDSNLYRETPRSCRWAWSENVARTSAGDAARAAMRMFMNSSSHRANILRPRMTHMGIGIAKRGRYTYVVQRFVDCTA